MTDDGDLIALRYRLVERVGSGAMGVVWQAEDELLRRTVAVKELLLHWGMSEDQTEEARRRAMREGRIAARLHHPNAISVYDVVEHEGRPCLIMEYLRSESLSDLLAVKHTLPPVDVARIGSQIASALASAHEAGIVHRDVKPGNVLLADDGTAKLTDFGISRAVGDATVTATGVLAGTPAYLAPEIAQGHDAGFPSDVFSLGATLYAAVEGTPPFGLNDNPMALLHYISTNEITQPKQAGPLTATLVWMLTRDAERRPTMREAGQALDALAGSEDVTVPVVEAPARTPVVAAEPAPAPVEPVDDAAAATAAAGTGAATEGAAAPVPAPAPVSTAARPAAAPVRDGGPTDPKRRRVIVAVGLVAAVLLTTGILVTLLNNGHGSSNAAGTSPTTTAPTTSAGHAVVPVSPTTTTKTAGSTTTTIGTTKPTTTTKPPAATTTTGGAAAGGGPPAATPDQLVATISDYYAMLPGGVAEGWSWMTANYQQNHAHGYANYKNFWAQFSSVSATDIHATGAHTVTATITYHYKSGNVSPERTTFEMVAESGQWKIDTSTG